MYFMKSQVCKKLRNFPKMFNYSYIAHANQRDVKYSHNSVPIIFFPDKINIMQYLYLLNVRFSIFQACLLRRGHHIHVSREIMQINLGII